MRPTLATILMGPESKLTARAGLSPFPGFTSTRCLTNLRDYWLIITYKTIRNMATAESPEYKSMRLVTHYLAVGVKAPLQLAGELFSERLICEDTLEKAGLECHTTYKRMTDVLSDVRSVIAAHPAAYEKLRKIFSRKPYLRHLADLMRDKLGESYHAYELL